MEKKLSENERFHTEKERRRERYEENVAVSIKQQLKACSHIANSKNLHIWNAWAKCWMKEKPKFFDFFLSFAVRESKEEEAKKKK